MGTVFVDFQTSDLLPDGDAPNHVNCTCYSQCLRAGFTPQGGVTRLGVLAIPYDERLRLNIEYICVCVFREAKEMVGYFI